MKLNKSDVFNVLKSYKNNFPEPSAQNMLDQMHHSVTNASSMKDVFSALVDIERTSYIAKYNSPLDKNARVIWQVAFEVVETLSEMKYN